jgi:hypothetical protein
LLLPGDERHAELWDEKWLSDLPKDFQRKIQNGTSNWEELGVAKKEDGIGTMR